MTKLSISVPKSMQEFIEGEAARRGHSSAAEYLKALIREDRKRRQQREKAREELEAKLLEGLNSPVSVMTDADWDEMQRKLTARHRKPASRRRATAPE
jgi:antitoxin ParD1/3/4